jgi:hypothetical protein
MKIRQVSSIAEGHQLRAFSRIRCRDEFPKPDDLFVIKILEISEFVGQRVNVVESAAETWNGGHQLAEKTRHTWRDVPSFGKRPDHFIRIGFDLSFLPFSVEIGRAHV